MSQWGRFFLTHFASKNESERNVPIDSFFPIIYNKAKYCKQRTKEENIWQKEADTAAWACRGT